MREIKFRAWDARKKSRGMSQPFTIAEYAIDQDYENGSDSLPGIGSSAVTVMQYTGLKDKNGVEIYEGDIVKEESGLRPTSPVTFSDGSFCAGDPYMGDDDYTWEVIGNIYESPDLLKSA